MAGRASITPSDPASSTAVERTSGTWLLVAATMPGAPTDPIRSTAMEAVLAGIWCWASARNRSSTERCSPILPRARAAVMRTSASESSRRPTRSRSAALAPALPRSSAERCRRAADRDLSPRTACSMTPLASNMLVRASRSAPRSLGSREIAIDSASLVFLSVRIGAAPPSWIAASTIGRTSATSRAVRRWRTKRATLVTTMLDVNTMTITPTIQSAVQNAESSVIDCFGQGARRLDSPTREG